MGADKSFLNAQGMWYGGDSPLQVAYLKKRAAIVMHYDEKVVAAVPQKADPS